MKHLLLLLSLAAGCTAAAQKRPATGGLSALQDSIWQWAADNKATDPVANAIYASAVNEPDGVIDVHMIRADTAMKARFRRRVHDSPLIRLHGFDPDTTPYPPAPEGAAPPDGLTMEAKYAFYPACTEHIRLTKAIRRYISGATTPSAASSTDGGKRCPSSMRGTHC